MHINKSILNSALATMFAVSIGFSPVSMARDGITTSAIDDDGTVESGDSPGAKSLDSDSGDDAGAKTLKTLPAVSAIAKDAPCVSWLPPEGGVKPRVAMLCIHGFSLHKGCYAAFGKEMAKDGIATYAMDMRGFGELKSTSEHTELDFDGCLADIKGGPGEKFTRTTQACL